MTARWPCCLPITLPGAIHSNIHLQEKQHSEDNHDKDNKTHKEESDDIRDVLQNWTSG